jgi:hypothetical protein
MERTHRNHKELLNFGPKVSNRRDFEVPDATGRYGALVVVRECDPRDDVVLDPREGRVPISEAGCVERMVHRMCALPGEIHVFSGREFWRRAGQLFVWSEGSIFP